MKGAKYLSPRDALRLMAALAALALGFAARRVPGRQVRIQAVLGRACARTLRYVGGAYVKLGQLLATRADLFHAAFRAPLSALQDEQSDMSLDRCLRALPPQVSADLLRRYTFIDHPLIGSGSVAQVFAATEKNSCRAVAIKIVRAESWSRFLRDAVSLRWAVARLARTRGLRGWPLTDAVRRCLRPICLQFNMPREAQLQARARLQYEKSGVIHIPAVLEVLHPRVLIMERVAGLARIGSRPATAPAALEHGLELLFEMVFVSGLLHCDLHPGNLLVGPAGELAVLDWGLAVQVSEAERTAIARFFLALVTGDAEAGSEVCLATATPFATVDAKSLRDGIDQLFARVSGAVAGDFDLTGFAAALIGVQARHGLSATPGFVLPIMAMASFEGELKRLDPHCDFQRIALPWVVQSLGNFPRARAA
ncbi:MAG: ubiquinone biosynthesis protein [Sphingomonadales bacterium]|nr:ubiquinone biosynthesis protein [Sphingomonadales bacterium]